MGIVTVAGIDPSLRNTGVAIAKIDAESNRIMCIEDLRLIQTQPSKVKTQRKSSADFQAASEIASTLRQIIQGGEIQVVFAEVPSGTQSARASFALGICTGLIASVLPTPIEVTPNQTKIHSIGIRTATKGEMIEWATERYPEAPWLKRGGRFLNSNEHLADAVGVIHAGLVSPEWTTIKNLLKSN